MNIFYPTSSLPYVVLIHQRHRTERTAPSKTTDRLSSVSLLMSVESNSGAADARATVTWPSAEVATSQTDRRTDGRHAILIPRFAYRALHDSASRGKNAFALYILNLCFIWQNKYYC